MILLAALAPAGAPYAAADPHHIEPPAHNEDFYDDAWEIGDVAALSAAITQAFGDRLGFISIHRSAEPSVLRVGVVPPLTAADHGTLSEVTDDNRRVALVPAKASAADMERFAALAQDYLIANGHEPNGIMIVRPQQCVLVFLQDQLPKHVEEGMYLLVPRSVVSVSIGSRFELLS